MPERQKTDLDRAHELQHENHPTWCIHCGKFTPWVWDNDYPCNGEPHAFDTRRPEGARLIAECIFGAEPEISREGWRTAE